MQSLIETPTQEIRDILEVNVIGAFVVMRESARKMLHTDGGQIINIASDAAIRGIARMGPYVASKHALLGLSRSMSLELRQQGVRMTTFCPGPISTDILGSGTGPQMRCHRKIWPKRSPIWLKFHQRLKYRSYWFNQHHDGNKYRCGSRFLQSYRPLFSDINLGENSFLREESAYITSARLRCEGLRSNQEYCKRGIL